MWIREFEIIKQEKKGDNIFVTLFKIIPWRKNTPRYHATIHQKEITKENFEQHYISNDFNFLTLNQAEALFNMMMESTVNVEPVKLKENVSSIT